MTDLETDKLKYSEFMQNWTGYIDFDGLIRDNKRGDVNPRYGEGHRAYAMIEERHTDQLASTRKRRMLRPICGAASPMPSALYSVSHMSLISLSNPS